MLLVGWFSCKEIRQENLKAFVIRLATKHRIEYLFQFDDNRCFQIKVVERIVQILHFVEQSEDQLQA
jgi:hypothetical protein